MVSAVFPLDIVAELLQEHKKNQDEEKSFFFTSYQDNGLVFCTELGKPIEPRNFNRKFYELIEKAGLPDANLHCLRHTFATRGLELGINPKVMQELMGHSTITLFMDTYAHVLPDLKRADTSKMNSLFKDKPTSFYSEKWSERKKEKGKGKDKGMSLEI